MRKKVTVFDFDKTLTDKDTLIGFYRTAAGSDQLFFAKRLLLLAAGVLYKAGLIRNDLLKSVGISLFLKGITRIDLEAAARKYAKDIELNGIYRDHYQSGEGEKWIVSAAPEVYLKHLFPGEKVAGTTFRYSGGKVKGLDVNMFGSEKKRFLSEKGIENLYEFYTDSASDKPLMNISEKVFLVKAGSIIQSR